MWVLGSFATILLSTLFVLVAALMVLVILVQKPKGGGLAGAFGGGGGGGDSQSMFGAKAGDVLTWITVSFFVVFLLLAIGLVFAARSDAETADTGVEAPARTAPGGQAPASPQIPGPPGAGDRSSEPAPAPEPEDDPPTTVPDPADESDADAPAPDGAGADGGSTDPSTPAGGAPDTTE